MQKTTFKLDAKASISLNSMLKRQVKKQLPLMTASMMGMTTQSARAVRKSDLVSVFVEATDAEKAARQVKNLGADEQLVPISENVLAARVSLDTVRDILKNKNVSRVQTKKKLDLHLDAAARDVGLIQATGTRTVSETGKGVLIGIVDSGFDLSHPMFRDSSGNLRVDGLLEQKDDQSAPTEYDNAQLTTGWGNGTNPGADPIGHGTHVASITGGTAYHGFEGIAPDARFLLVKTNFLDTTDGAKWIFNKAGTKPCVVNMSLGGHWGAHDGTSVDEIALDQISGPGKIIVASAGNEREWSLHVGGRFTPGQTETVPFTVLRSRNVPPQPPFAPMTFWYQQNDDFDISLISPTGQVMAIPAVGSTTQFSLSGVDIELSRQSYPASSSVQVQIVLSFRSANVSQLALQNWKIRIHCNTAVIGRIDGWVANSGMAIFSAHPLVEQARTVGMPATAKSVIAVASHTSKSAWNSDNGPQNDPGLVIGRSSSFSSLGPTRDGRQKPDLSAPGELLTAALASNSDFASELDRAVTADRLLTIEGTSMASPVVAGAVCLFLQKKKTLKPDDIRSILQATCRKDLHTGAMSWNPMYGYGKLDIKSAIDSI